MTFLNKLLTEASKMAYDYAGQALEYAEENPCKVLAIGLATLTVALAAPQWLTSAQHPKYYADQLITDGMDGEDRDWVIWGLSSVAAGDRADFIEKTRLLITDGMNGADRARVIYALARVAAGDRADVAEKTRLLITDGMNGEDRSWVIYALARVAAGDRADVAEKTRLLITDGMNGEDRSWVIGALGSVAAEDRADVIEQTRLLITDGMNGEDRSHVIGALNSVAAGDRADVAEKTRLFITDGMNGADRASVIRALARVAAGDRADVAEKTRLFITDGMNGYNRACVIDALARVAAENRTEVVARALGQLELEGQAFHVWRLVELLETPLDQPLLLLLDGGMAAAAAAGAIGINVHAAGREHRTRIAIELLRENQGAMDSETIAQSITGFTQFLNVYPDEAIRNRALHALSGPNSNKDYGPLLGNQEEIISGLPISGEEVIGRLWRFASDQPDSDSERNNSQLGMISALNDSYTIDNERVCNPGKIQRLAINVLQGRLPGVNIDQIPTVVPTPQALNTFFAIEARQHITTLNELREAAEAFCRENPSVQREEFMRGIDMHAELQGIE